ncbi:hypothetical protein WJX73_004746 [Symbiochloris irregularis]|uniref:Uncharacterized protein n=1 Tax=Symbiochloris irregularis TaxID=706552 RepID=A0AAW1P7V7_9CHLO
MTKRSREEPCHICGHFHDYEGGEACSTCGHVMKPAEAASHPKASKFPDEIISHRLYLGSFDNASRVELLKAMGITHILCCMSSCQPLYKNSFVYHTVSSNPADFNECAQFLETVLEERPENRILVHCMTGISRSPSVTIAFLMKLRRWRLVESFQWVKQRRPSMHLSAGDAERLQLAEVQMLGSSSVGAQFADGSPGSAGQGAGPFSWSWQDSLAASHPPAQQAPLALPSVLNLNFASQPGHQGTGFAFGNR